MTAIHARNDTPVHLQVCEAIRKDILAKGYRPGDQYATYAQLAERFGVAIGTVQKAMNVLVGLGAVAGRPRRGTLVVSLDPLMNPIPRTGVTDDESGSSRSRLVGMITTDIASDHFYAEVIRGVQDAVSGAGYDLVIANSDEDARKEAAAAERLLSKGVEGLIINPVVGRVQRGHPHTRRLLEGTLPVVLVDKRYSRLSGDSVVSDNMAGAYRLTCEILQRGHRRLGFITEPACSSVLDRQKGFLNAVSETGPGVCLCEVVGGELFYQEAGAVHGRELLERAPENRPTAIFACNDQVARGVYEACDAVGLSVGHDVSIVGYDGMPFAETLTPPLATVRQPRYEMGFEAGKLIVERIERGKDESRTVVVKGEMLLRESLGSPPALLRVQHATPAPDLAADAVRGNRLQRNAHVCRESKGSAGMPNR